MSGEGWCSWQGKWAGAWELQLMGWLHVASGMKAGVRGGHVGVGWMGGVGVGEGVSCGVVVSWGENADGWC